MVAGPICLIQIKAWAWHCLNSLSWVNIAKSPWRSKRRTEGLLSGDMVDNYITRIPEAEQDFSCLFLLFFNLKLWRGYGIKDQQTSFEFVDCPWHDQLEIGEEVVAEDPTFSAGMWLAAELLVCFPEHHSALGVTDGCAEDGGMPGPLGSATPFHFYDT